jgi:ferredoxin
MPTITIDGQKVTVDPGKTLLDAAQQLSIRIPTLCHIQGSHPFTSCMVCVVKDKASGRLLPACSATAVDGMVVETRSEEVCNARKTALELFLSEHVGDCEGPCQRACPAHIDLPLMIRQIGAGQVRDALVTVKRDLPFPAVLGRICPAPCEKVCRRAQHDGPVSICLLKRFAGDADITSATPYLPPCKPTSNKKVAIVGAGPAGLTAAYFLLQRGHACTIFDDRDKPGGMLQYGVDESKLPRHVLDAEIEILRRIGAVFKPHMKIGINPSIDDLANQFQAVILTVGKIEPAAAAAFGVEVSQTGIKINPRTFETSRKNFFAGGGATQPGRMAVRACAHGKAIAHSVNHLLHDATITGLDFGFNSRVGKLVEGEIDQFLKEAAQYDQVETMAGIAAGYLQNEAVKETARCLHCDCRKYAWCRLRIYADDYAAQQHLPAETDRRHFERNIQHPEVIYEPGKCIKCGICVRITERAKERFGLTFIGRGFDTRVGAPFNESMANALEKTAAECVQECPTGALAWRKG